MKSLSLLAIEIMLCLGFYQHAGGQNRTIDSLKNVLLTQKADTNKALTYVRLSEQYVLIVDTAAIFIYADSALSLARQLSFGLGLSLSYDIVKAHGGELKVKSKPGESTEFLVEIPTV